MTRVTSCRFSLEGADLLCARASAEHFDPHLHETHSVVLLLNGRVSLRCRRWSATAEAGDVFIFNPFEVHGGGSSNAAVDYQVLYPSPRLVADCFGVSDWRLAWPTLHDGIVRRSAVTHALAEEVRRSTISTALLEAALAGVLRECSVEEQHTETKSLQAVRTACAVMHERYAEPLCTERLAQYALLHKCHFIRVFHRITGLAPQNYLRQIRLARSRELLCAGIPPSEAAHATGFSDQAHLTREFKKVYGVTPGHLGRNLRSSRENGSHCFE